MPMIREARASARARGASKGVSPRDIDLLLADAIGREPVWLLAHDDESIGEDALGAFDAALERRIAGEPMQYIRGRCEFYGREYRVDSRVLIPRPETELLVERVIRNAARGARVVDVGTGSGCIAITLAAERPDLRVVAVDTALSALAVARANAVRLGTNVVFAGSDLLSACHGHFDIIVSNPPYVAERDRSRLQREVVAWEPHAALFAGFDGMSVIERLLAEATSRLARGGFVALEIGWDQGELLRRLAVAGRWQLELHPDLAGIPRIAMLGRI
ncbi:MAG: peptide chain release factor N(5)-glutamine methyltransferase [Acidobacteria bacterium]|nr:peptide chain release factor N(5)-glutamine methyltransferase [Acidobacteriota bacterium]